MAGRIEDYAIVGETRTARSASPAWPQSVRIPGMSAEACQAKSIQTATL